MRWLRRRLRKAEGVDEVGEVRNVAPPPIVLVLATDRFHTCTAARRLGVAVYHRRRVGPGGHCSPRHPTHFEPSSLE
jgi:hypothetical protein